MSDRCHKCDCRLSPEHDRWADGHQFCETHFDGRFGEAAAEAITELRQRVESAEAKVSALTDLLRTLEWVGTTDGWQTCPVCGICDVHAPDCALSEALR